MAIDFIGDIVGGIAGYKAADKAADASQYAADKNYEIALENLGFQEETRDLMLQLYEEQLRRAGVDRALAGRQQARDRADVKAGVTDEFGNRTRFIEGVGWVTENSPRTQQLLDLMRNQQRYNLGEAETMRRDAARRENARGLEEGRVADSLRDQFLARARSSPEGISNQMFAADAASMAETNRAAREGAAAGAMRSGNTSNLGQIVRQPAFRPGTGMYRAAGGLGAAEVAANRDSAGGSNLLQMFRGMRNPRAGGTGANVQLRGAPSPGGLPSNVSRFSSQGGARIPGIGTPQMDYIQPNFGDANKYAALSGTIPNIANSLSDFDFGNFFDSMDFGFDLGAAREDRIRGPSGGGEG